MLTYKIGNPLLVFTAALLCGAVIGAALPRGRACSVSHPYLNLTSVEGDPAEVEKWKALFAENGAGWDGQIVVFAADASVHDTWMPRFYFRFEPVR